MIEVGEYKVFIAPLAKVENESVEHSILRYQERLKDVAEYLQYHAKQYEANTKKGIGVSPNPFLQIKSNPQERSYSVDISCTSAFRDYLEKQDKPDFVKSIEAESGAQYMVFAGFISSPHASNVGYGGSGSLSANEFWRVSHGIQPGKVLTEAEKQARVEMNDRVFEKLSDGLRNFKQRFPHVVIELEEKALGSFFLRVTTEENKEYGVSSYELSNVMRNVAQDKDNVEAVLAGPALYPTHVEKLRQKDEPRQPDVRKPKKLDL